MELEDVRVYALQLAIDYAKQFGLPYNVNDLMLLAREFENYISPPTKLRQQSRGIPTLLDRFKRDPRAKQQNRQVETFTYS